MRLQYLISICLLLLLGLLPLSAANVPLTLTATADREVLLAQRLQYFKGLENSPKYDVESAKVTLTFTNTGDAPLKLDTLYLTDYRLQLVISGPDEQSVVMQHLKKEMTFHPPSEQDFPLLQPGKSCSMAIAFPQQDINFASYMLQHPGVYHLRFLYAYMPNKAELANENPLAVGAFQGTVASNSIAFTLLEASQPEQGLEIALQAQPATDPLSKAITLTGYFRNVSEKSITIDSWDLYINGLQLSGTDGKVIPYSGGRNGLRVVTMAERYTTIPPGEKHDFPLQFNYSPALDTLTHQLGSLSVLDKSGFFRQWPVLGNSVTAVAQLEMAETRSEQEPGVPGPLWRGKVTSPATVIPLNPTAYRQAKLKQGIGNFSLELDYVGPEQNKPYYSPRFQVQPLPVGAVYQFTPSVQLSTTEATALIDYLAKSGALRDATTVEMLLAGVAGNIPPPADGYTMVINGSPLPGDQELACWSLVLGWNRAMYQQFVALQAQLPKDGRIAMDLLLTRLGGLHDIWEAEDALCRPAVTLDTPAGTLIDAANAIIAALHAPTVKLSIDPFTGTTSVNAYHFFNVTANEAFQSLADATDVNYTARGANAVFHALVN